jgi:F-box-like/CBL proto-oncogene N-terminus, EF hand-like domain
MQKFSSKKQKQKQEEARATMSSDDSLNFLEAWSLPTNAESSDDVKNWFECAGTSRMMDDDDENEGEQERVEESPSLYEKVDGYTSRRERAAQSRRHAEMFLAKKQKTTRRLSQSAGSLLFGAEAGLFFASQQHLALDDDDDDDESNDGKSLLIRSALENDSERHDDDDDDDDDDRPHALMRKRRRESCERYAASSSSSSSAPSLHDFYACNASQRLFDSLSDELLLCILAKLPSRDVAQVQLVNSRWHRLCNDRSMARKLVSHNMRVCARSAVMLRAAIERVAGRSRAMPSASERRLRFLHESVVHFEIETQPLYANFGGRYGSSRLSTVPRQVAVAATAAAVDDDDNVANDNNNENGDGNVVANVGAQMIVRDGSMRALNVGDKAFRQLSERVMGRLIRALEQCMWEARTFLLSLRSPLATLGDHFDSFDLTVRRHVAQLNSMFPRGNLLEAPSSMIDDSDARQLWLDTFGERCYSVSFDVFYERVIVALFSASSLQNAQLRQCLAYFVNFPRDDIISVYKFQLLIRLFGPLQLFADTFERTVLGAGFLGAINRIRAEELLQRWQRRRSPPLYLLRFSRTAINYLVISHIADIDAGTVVHRLINRDSNRSSSLDSALRLCFGQNSRFKPLPMQVDGAAIIQLESLSSLSSQMNGYGYVIYQ